MNPARPKLTRLPTLLALAVGLWLPLWPAGSGALAQQPPVPPTAPKPAAPHAPAIQAPAPHPAPARAAPAPAGAGRPTPVVNAPQKPNAQRPPGAAAAPPAALPAPPVPPSEVPPPQTGPAQPETPAEPTKGSSTGNPLPRFAALRSDDVNFRVGPGTRYPIEWTYKRKDLPILIERELDVWRLVRDPEGTRGWVHVATLTTRRSFMVTGGERTLRRSAAEDARAVARLQAGVIGQIRSCKADMAWCQVQVGEYRGWLKRDDFWGTLPNEAVN